MNPITHENGDRLRIMELGAICGIPPALAAAIKLGVPEILSKQGAPLSAAEILASRGSGSSVNLERILRVLSSVGVFEESLDQGVRKFGLTPLCRYLVPGENATPISSWVLLNQEEAFLKTWNFLYESVTDGSYPFATANGKTLFEFALDHPDFDGRFNLAMSDNSKAHVPEIVKAYHGFKGIRTLVDVGGGLGSSLSVVVSHHPHIKGINYDLPIVIAKAPSHPGVEHVEGDMFREVPKGDMIFMKWILHDWDDDACILLLKNCYKSLPEDGNIVVVDSVLPSSGTSQSLGSRFAFNMDLLMLAYTPGGKERTFEEFEALAKAAGFARANLVLTVDFLSVIEMHKL